MTAGMPDFAMPSAEEVERARAQADDDAREADARAALARRDDAGVDVAGDGDAGDLPSAAATSTRDQPVVQRRGGRILALARNPVIAFAAGALLVATGFLVVPQLTALAERGSAAQMRDVFDAYVDAVSAGDVEAALALHVPDDDVASLELMEAGVAPTTPAVVTCTEPEVRGEGEAASASCETAVQGSYGASTTAMPVLLERIDGDWRIGAGLVGQANIPAALFAITAIAGVDVGESAMAPGETHWLLPGSYDVETVTSDLIEVEDFGGLEVAGGYGYLNMWAQPAPAVMEAAQTATGDWVTACLADAASAATCGLEPPVEGAEISLLGEGGGFQQTATSIAVPVRVVGTGTFPTPTVEVLVEFSDDWTSYELAVTGITTAYG